MASKNDKKVGKIARAGQRVVKFFQDVGRRIGNVFRPKAKKQHIVKEKEFETIEESNKIEEIKPLTSDKLPFPKVDTPLKKPKFT